MEQFFSPLNITLGVLLICSVLFVRGKIRSDLVAMGALLVLVLTGVLDTTEALAGFSNPVPIMMIGLFIVGAGIFRTGLAKMISSRILRLAGTNETKLFVLLMLVTGAIGAFVSNTGTVAVMMPIIISMAASADINPRRYLMPLAFAGSMSMFTLISTPPNLIIHNALIEAGYKGLSFFSFAPIGLTAVVTGIAVLFLLSKLLVKGDNVARVSRKTGKSFGDLVEKYSLSNLLYKIEVKEGSTITGKTLAQLEITSRHGVSIGKIVRYPGHSRLRRNVTEEVAGPQSVLRHSDIIYCYGTEKNIERFVEDYGLYYDKKNNPGLFPEFQDSGIAEAYILPDSKLINHTITETRFREEFQVNVIGIKRYTDKDYQTDDIRESKLHAGDALLVQGTWKDLAALDERQGDLVLVGQPLKEAAKVTLDRKAPIAAIIMTLMILAMVVEVVPTVVAILVAAGLMIFTGCLRNVEEAYGSINWESVVLIAAMLPMSTAFHKTGADTFIAEGLVSKLGEAGPYALLAGVYFCTSLLTMFISNTATAVLFTPIALSAAQTMGLSPYPFLFAVAVAATMCFASPFATAPNAIVMHAGRYKFSDYIRVGLPLQIIMGIVMIIVLPMLFSFEL